MWDHKKAITNGRNAGLTDDEIIDGQYGSDIRQILYPEYIPVCSVHTFSCDSSVPPVYHTKAEKHGKLGKYPAMPLMKAGQIASIISVAAILIAITVFSDKKGLTASVRNTANIVQILCMIVCVVSAAVSLILLIKEKKRRLIYAVCMICCIITVCAILCFEMYK